MKYPLIIFGAGASHDFLERNRMGNQHTLNAWVPPLTNNIFDTSLFGEIIQKYEDIKQLASAVSNFTDGRRLKPFDFEKYLSASEKSYPEKSQNRIMALRFYLSELFSKVSHFYYRDTNNHRHLIGEIENRGLGACIVNYNYDLLLEKNIPSILIGDKIQAYVEGNIKVIKIHGACNWRYSPETDLMKKDAYDFFVSRSQHFNEDLKNRDVYPVSIKGFDYSRNEEFDTNVYRENKDGDFPGGKWLYYPPAIAIPIGTKGNHVCPKSHISTLIDQLKVVDRILIVGWRAQDEFLLGLLKQYLPKRVKLTIVSKGNTKKSYYIKKFNDVSQIDKTKITLHDKGYTEFMINEDYKTFFK